MAGPPPGHGGVTGLRPHPDAARNWPPAVGRIRGRVIGRRYRVPAGLLAWVPAGWRAAGRLQVKNAEHELACHLDLHLGGTRPDGSPRIVIASS